MTESKEAPKTVALPGCPTCGEAPEIFPSEGKYAIQCPSCIMDFIAQDADLDKACKQWRDEVDRRERLFEVSVPRIIVKKVGFKDLTVYSDATFNCPFCNYSIVEKGMLYSKAIHLCYGFEPAKDRTVRYTGLPKLHDCPACDARFSATPDFNVDETDVITVRLRFIPKKD